jgi:hypothetical protein
VRSYRTRNTLGSRAIVISSIQFWAIIWNVIDKFYIYFSVSAFVIMSVGLKLGFLASTQTTQLSNFSIQTKTFFDFRTICSSLPIYSCITNIVGYSYGTPEISIIKISTPEIGLT